MIHCSQQGSCKIFFQGHGMAGAVSEKNFFISLKDGGEIETLTHIVFIVHVQW